jgi:hopene-associated glycosyltransferase HpnB
MTLSLLMLLSASCWAAVLVAPIRPSGTRERLDAGARESAADLTRITALVPARNEAATIEKTLESLRHQGGELNVIVIDDQSTDATARIVERCPQPIRLIQGKPTPPGWLGKVWALEQGLNQVETPLVLIELSPRILAALQEKLDTGDLGLISLMARLRTASAWERLLVPAYIYFFKLLYPFSLVNSPRSGIAAAAGGCVLARRSALQQIGGFERIRGAVIDDCALAAAIKRAGYPIWLGLTNSVRSLRAYDGLADLWGLVARSAFAELRFSVLRLLICTAAMLTLFGLPVCTPFLVEGSAGYFGLLALVLMLASYLPVLRFYSLSPARAVTLPLVAAAYLAMTWHSALRCWCGRPTIWKNRSYVNLR